MVLIGALVEVMNELFVPGMSSFAALPRLSEFEGSLGQFVRHVGSCERESETRNRIACPNSLINCRNGSTSSTGTDIARGWAS
eukprot:608878-Amphidinium_carterae.1